MNVVTTRNLIESQGINKPELAEELSKIGVPTYSTSSIRWLKIRKLLHADWISHGLTGVLLNWIKRVSHYRYKHGMVVLLILVFNTATLLTFAIIFQTWTAFYILTALTIITFVITITLDNHESGVASWMAGTIHIDNIPNVIWGKTVPSELLSSISKIIRYNKTHSHSLTLEAEEMLLSISGTNRMDPAPERCHSPLFLWVVERSGDNINGFKSRRACIGIIP